MGKNFNTKKCTAINKKFFPLTFVLICKCRCSLLILQIMKQDTINVFGATTPTGRYITTIDGKTYFTDPRNPLPGAVDVVCISHHPEQTDIHSVKQALESAPPASIVLISSWEVYAHGTDSKLYENSRIAPESDFGRRCMEAERLLTDTARTLRVPLAILRPAMLFGSDVRGESSDLFAKVVSDTFFTIRNIQAPRSCVLAFDVARVALMIAGTEGIFNVTDGTPHPLHEIADAMSANTGKCKRTPVMPFTPAKILASICERTGFCRNIWGRNSLRLKSTPRTASCAELMRVLPDFKPFDTLSVLSRQNPDYPYQQ